MTVFWETVPAQYLPLDPLARSRSNGDAADRQGHLRERARRRQGRTADAGRQPAVRPAVGDHLRPGVHGASLQAPDDRQHDATSRPRRSTTSATSTTPTTCRRTRRWPSSATSTRRRRCSSSRSISAACRKPSARAARHRQGAAVDAREARDAAGAVAAAGGRRRLSHHLRRPSGLVSAAHRVEGAVRRPELAHLQEARVRAGHRAGGVGRGEHHRGSEPVLCGRVRPAGAPAGRGDRRRSSRSSIG